MTLRVTEILTKAGLIDATWFTEESRQRGTAVHVATWLDDQGNLDEDSVDAAVRPYLESYRAFKRQSIRDGKGITIISGEFEVRDRVLDYVGHPDRALTFPGSPRHWIVDLKTGEPARWHTIQTALYAMTYEGGSGTPRRAALYLRSDGQPATLIRHLDEADFRVAQAAVTIVHFLENK